MMGLELGGVSVGACNGAGSSEECDKGVKFPDEKDVDVGGCSDEASAD